VAIEQLAESEHRVKRSSQLVADAGEKVGFGFAGRLDLLDTIALGNVLNGALVVKNRSGSVADGASIFVEPDSCPVLSVGLVFKQLHQTLCLHETLEFFAPRWIDLHGTRDIGDLA